MSGVPHRGDRVREVDAPARARSRRGAIALLRAGSLAGISPRTLSLRLRALEDEGIVERHTFPEVPPRVEYALTDKGRALLPIIEAMRDYGRTWLRDAESVTERERSEAELRADEPVSASVAAA